MEQSANRSRSGPEIWERYCAAVDGLIDKFGKRLGALQRRYAMNEPCRSFFWDSGESRCSLSFLLCAPPAEGAEPDYRLAIWAVAYCDDGEQLTRRLWELPEPFLLTTPVTPKALTPVLEQAMTFLATAPLVSPPTREVPICGLPG